MATKAKSHLPAGLRSITPQLSVKSAREAIEFYKKAFGAEVKSQAPGPAPGSIMHAEVRIGDSVVFLADEMPGSPLKTPADAGGPTALLTVFVPDADAVFKQA